MNPAWWLRFWADAYSVLAESLYLAADMTDTSPIEVKVIKQEGV